MRLSSCFGTSQNLSKDSGFFSYLLYNIINRKKFIIYDNLSRSRYLLFLEDLNFILENFINNPPNCNTTYNVTGKKLSIKKILHSFKKLGYPINYDINKINLKFVDQFNYLISDKKLLSYQPNFNYTKFDNALSKTLQSVDKKI